MHLDDWMNIAFHKRKERNSRITRDENPNMPTLECAFKDIDAQFSRATDIGSARSLFSQSYIILGKEKWPW